MLMQPFLLGAVISCKIKLAMSFYTPDYDYQNGKKMLEELKGMEGELIRYYVAENEKYAKKLQERIDEMQKVFDGIRKFVG